MNKLLVDNLLADSAELAKVKAFFKAYPSVNSATKDLQTILQVHSAVTLSNEYILKLLRISINISTVYVDHRLYNELDTLLKPFIQSISRYYYHYTGLPFNHLTLDTIRGITFQNIYNAFKKIRSVEPSKATLVDNPLALASFKSVTKKLSGVEAEKYLTQIKNFSSTKADYIKFILDNCVPTKSLKKFLTGNLITLHSSTLRRLDLDKLEPTENTPYIVLHPGSFRPRHTNTLLLPTAFRSPELSRITSPIIGMDSIVPLDQFNVEMWYSYLLIVEYYLAKNPPYTTALIRARQTLVTELSKPVYKDQIATLLDRLAAQATSFKSIAKLLG